MNESDIILEPPPEVAEELRPITEEQWVKILNGRKVCVLVQREQIAWAGKRAVKCGQCTGTHMYSDPRRGWCVRHKIMVSDAFPKLCREFAPR